MSRRASRCINALGPSVKRPIQDGIETDVFCACCSGNGSGWAGAGSAGPLLCFDDPPSTRPSPSAPLPLHQIPSNRRGVWPSPVATKAGRWQALNPFRASIAPLPIWLFQFLPPPRLEHE